MEQLPLGVRLADRARFESFLAGPNAAALAAVREASVAMRREVLWLCGPAGSGKTHLLQAASAAASARGRSAYLRLGERLAPAALEGWGGASCLCLDDVQRVAGAESWEQALFTLYRDTEDSGTSLILGAPMPPRQAGFKLPDLASRFAAATIFSLKLLGEAEQDEALRLRARLRGLELPEESLLYLKRHAPRDPATLYALLDTLDAAALQAQRRLTIPFIRDVLGLRPDAR